MKRRVRYAPPKGPVAIAPKAWGADFFFFESAAQPIFTLEGPYAVVEVAGPLSQHEGFCFDSYDEIRSRLASALESEAPQVCLRIDSPGGDYTGAIELSRDLRAMAAAAGKRLVAFTDGQALSAGYAIACAAEEIVSTDSAAVGSIGVWAPLVDLTAQDAMFGAKVMIAASGVAKSDRNPHVGITDEAFARLQAQIDEQAALFFDLVSECRGLPISKIKALDGAELFGQRGIAAGLSDRLVNSWSAFLTSQGTPMATKASKYDEAMGALKRAAEGDDEDAKKAKKALKALEEPTEDEKKKDDDDKAAAAAAAEAKSKSEADDKEKDEKKKDEEAKAMAHNAVALAKEVATLKAAEATRVAAEAKAAEDTQRAALFAQRPDFSEAQKKTLAKMPLADVDDAVKNWPKATALPGSAAAAMTPTLGRERQAYEPTLSAEEQALLAGSDPSRKAAATAPTQLRGTGFHVNYTDPKVALARLAELEKETV
jgi:ClpP class serine protease